MGARTLDGPVLAFSLLKIDSHGAKLTVSIAVSAVIQGTLLIFTHIADAVPPPLEATLNE